MEPPISSSVCVRLTPKCRDSVQLVLKNSSYKKQIRLINRNSNDFVLYEFDQIYKKQTKNQELYENMIFPQTCSSLLDVESGLFCFLGSQGVGKTYTVTGQLNNVLQNCGLLSYFMQDVFYDSNNHHGNKIQNNSLNNNLVQLRFLQILGDNVENIGFQTIYGESTNNERQSLNRIDYKIDIKSLAHFQNCINKIYERKKPHMHLVIQVSIKNQPLIYTTKKTTMTFIQISSACFDEGNAHAQKIKSEVQALITIFQNIPRIKHLQHLFQSSKLTKLLKNNFFEAKKISLIGILDNSFKGNSMTLKWLKMALELKQDKTIIESMKQDIKKQEDYLKNLMQKHKKAMTLLSKCIGTELSFLQKQKNFSSTSKRQIQFGFGNSFNKRCQKIKIANLKKQQNQEEIQKFNKMISIEQEQIQKLEDKYKQDFKKLQEQRNQIICVKNKLISKMEETNQQMLYKNVFNNTNNNSLYWRPQIDFQNIPVNSAHQKKNDSIIEMKQIITKKDLNSRNSSFKMSAKKINNAYGTQPPSTTASINKIQRKKYDCQTNQHNFLLQVQRQQSILKQQTKRQIYELFMIISQQQKQLQQSLKQFIPKLPTKLINRIKNRQQNPFAKQINQNKLNIFLKEGKQFQLKSYLQFVKNQSAFLNFSKDLLQKDKKTQQTIVTNAGS